MQDNTTSLEEKIIRYEEELNKTISIKTESLQTLLNSIVNKVKNLNYLQKDVNQLLDLSDDYIRNSLFPNEYI